MMQQPRHVKGGDVGFDITAYRRALDKYRNDPDAKAGPGWPRVTDGDNYHAVGRSLYDTETKQAVAAVKKRKSITERGIGAQTFNALTPYIDAWGWLLLRKATPTCPVDVAHGEGRVIGYPYQGTHDHAYRGDPMHNWESCNAIDLALPYGTPLYAVCAGTIGSQIGPLDSGNPVLMGQRFHLILPSNEAYYAHLSFLAVQAGQRVRPGQWLGRSGSANSVNHLHLASKHGDPAHWIGESSPGYRDQGYPG